MTETQAHLRPALVAASPRLGAVGARRDQYFNRIATAVTVLSGALAVLVVAAAAVAFALG